jgi:hypothetical protein
MGINEVKMCTGLIRAAKVGRNLLYRYRYDEPNGPTKEGPLSYVRGVLGNKCAGQHNLKTVHFRDTLASGNFWAGSSAICVFFFSALSTLGRR